MTTLKTFFSRGTATSKKYELLKDQTIEFAGATLYRIRALKDSGSVKAGDLGGYVAAERNLDQDGGNAWIEEQSIAYGNSRIYGNAQIEDKSRISGNARILIALSFAPARSTEKPGYTATPLFGQWFGGKSLIHGQPRHS